MKLKQILEKNAKWIALFICIVLIIAIVEDVLDKEIEKLDIAGYSIISKYLISDKITPIAKTITQFGGATLLIIIATILLILIKNKKTGILIWINLIISTFQNRAGNHVGSSPTLGTNDVSVRTRLNR